MPPAQSPTDALHTPRPVKRATQIGASAASEAGLR
jgi:hypothetical protein